MTRAWLAVFPLLFLPDFGYAIPTPVGVVSVADFVVFPYLAFVSLSAMRKSPAIVNRLIPILLLFTAWSVIGILLIPDRFPYRYESPVLESSIKLARVFAYGCAGILTARALGNTGSYRPYSISLMVSAAMVGLFFIASRGDRAVLMNWYENQNGMSIVMAMLLIYFFAHWIERGNQDTWPKWFPVGLGIIALGIVLSNGRGGWLAVAAGVSYLLWKRGLRKHLLVPIVLGIILIPILYQAEPNFKREIDRSFFPDRAAQFHYEGTRVVGNVDDGARLELWAEEGPKWLHSPLIGTGYFHRGEESGLNPIGSHNYFIQILLETGLPGLILVSTVLLMMWNQAGSERSKTLGLHLPTRAMLIVATVGALGGEYFYDGRILFVLIAAYAPVGAIERQSEPVHKREPICGNVPIAAAVSVSKGRG